MKLVFNKIGQGHPFVILHGLYGCSDNWVSFARKYSSKYQFIIPDLRNHGNSPFSESHTYNDMVEDIIELFYFLEIEKAIIMGHSMGGKLAMKFASVYPEMISSLIIADIAPKNYTNLHSKWHKELISNIKSIDLRAVNSRLDVEERLRHLINDERILFFILKSLTRDKNKNFRWKINIPVLENNLDEIVNGFSLDFFKNKMFSSFPVLFLKGQNSDYIIDSDIAHIKRIYPDSVIKEISNAGHWLHVDNPIDFDTEIMKFIF